jgi:hypothetical protein
MTGAPFPQERILDPRRRLTCRAAKVDGVTFVDERKEPFDQVRNKADLCRGDCGRHHRIRIAESAA